MKNTKQTISNVAQLPFQYVALVQELGSLLNIGSSNKLISKSDLIKYVNTIFMIDQCDYTKRIIEGPNQYASEYKIPAFLKFIVLPYKLVVPGLPMETDLIQRYLDISISDVFNTLEFDKITRLIKHIVGKLHLNLPLECEAITPLRSTVTLDQLFTQGMVELKLRDNNIPCIFESIEAVNIKEIDDLAHLKVEEFIFHKLQ